MERIHSVSELLDVVNLQGEPTGERFDKAIIHQNGLWHRDVHVWLTNGTHLLEQQRTWDKKIMPGVWDISVGGHVMASETYLDAAVRETHEELGLAFKPERFMFAGKLAIELAMEDGAWIHRVVGDHFVVVEPNLSINQLKLQASEVLAARWYLIDQLEQDLSQPETANRHAPQPLALWTLGITAMRCAMQ